MKKNGNAPQKEPREPRTIPPLLQRAASETLATAKLAAIATAARPAEDYSLYTVHDAIRGLAQLFNDSQLRASAMGFGPKASRQSAEDAWREALPELTNKHSALIYIAAVAWGMRVRILETNEAKLMIFLAQTQLTVLRMDTTPPLRDGTLRTPPQDTRQLSLLPPTSATAPCAVCGGPMSSKAAEAWGIHCSSDCHSNAAVRV